MMGFAPRPRFGALAFVAAVAFPRPTGEGGRLALSLVEPGPPGLVEKLDSKLARRMPGLNEDDRRRVARTLVVEAEAAKMDPLLVLALIETESSYDPSAKSSRGAFGLMQLREPTLRREMELAGRRWGEAADPAVNVQAGIRYLRRLLDAFGHQDTALMAYNAGPNRILGYLREGEVPARFRTFPAKVKARADRLHRSFGNRGAAAIALSPASRAPDREPE